MTIVQAHYMARITDKHIERVDRRLHQTAARMGIRMGMIEVEDGYLVTYYHATEKAHWKGTINMLPMTLEVVAKWLDGVNFGITWANTVRDWRTQLP